jgi:4-hydroxy-tetrahydrodipicolinate synthase
MSQPLFKGVLPALVTPFRDGAVDEPAFVALVERQIAGGVHGLVPVGTTGETSTLSHDEHRRVVELCVETTAGRVPVVAGAGANSTAEAIELVRHAKTVGAHAALVVHRRGYLQRDPGAALQVAEHGGDQGRHR